MFKSLEIYNYLIDNCIGYDKRVKSKFLMEKFRINSDRTLRTYIESARTNPICEYFIGSEAGIDGGYWIATNEKEKNTTLDNLIQRAKKMLENANEIKGKNCYEEA